MDKKPSKNTPAASQEKKSGSESNPKHRVKNPSSQATSSNTQKPSTNETPKAPSNGLVEIHLKSGLIACALVACLGTGLGGYSLWTSLHKSHQSDSDYLSLLQQMQKLNIDVQKDKAQIDNLGNTLGTLHKATQKVETSLAAQKESLSKALIEKQDDNSRWALKRSLYLMQLAQLSLRWNHNLSETTSLLNQALLLLKQASDPNLLDIRQSLVKEISALKAIEPIDKLDVLTQLQALGERIEHLPTEPLVTATDIAAQTESKGQSGWREHLAKSWQAFQKLIVIRHHEQSIKPLLAPEQRKVLNELIQLSLQQAQWAIIHDNARLFHFNLNQAAKQIKKHFNDKQYPVAQLLKQLDQLKNLNLQPELPDISQSQQQLKQYLKQQLTQNIDEEMYS